MTKVGVVTISLDVVLYLPFDGAPTKGVIKDQSEYGNHGKLLGKAKVGQEW